MCRLGWADREAKPSSADGTEGETLWESRTSLGALSLAGLFGIIRLVDKGEGTLMDERHYDYTVILEREADGGYHAFCPALKGCHTQGSTIEEALERVQEAIKLYVEDLKAEGEPIPTEDILIKSVKVAA
jgi:predicted RNase H-like HicB family nuclease